MAPQRYCRVLLIEDDEVRIERIASWMPNELRLVVARSPGRAIATLRIDGPTTYAGVMLDHDLQQQALAAEEAALSGSDLVKVVISRVDHDVPVLVHSMNFTRAPLMVDRLKQAGFTTTYIPFELLTRPAFDAWLSLVRELWDDQ